ncbi:hypothetical protein [Paraburkholderia largidicola]|uniref:Uncharacterized protein n=1 Tax=Paraburkholderia largidicola TaxID=3014751 RepID=A0A7I8C168_9BURK|nr:hypothetical protein [Paraburkholderia sp. PGU16]BCF94198.1 hypothetical protein PPGU16_72650 [Paraburkholderia sp. PGU16]
MSIMMVLEIERGVESAKIVRILESTGATAILDKQPKIHGNFPISNMFYSYEECSALEGKPKAEDFHGDWAVGSRIVFVYVNDRLADCSSQLHDFLRTIDEIVFSRWVLSFQYESVCAMRDRHGTHYLKDF